MSLHSKHITKHFLCILVYNLAEIINEVKVTKWNLIIHSSKTAKIWQFISSCAGGRHNMPRPLQVDAFDFESGVRVTCDVGDLCVNFSLPRPLDLGPMYATDRCQTDRETSDVRRASSLNAADLWGRGQYDATPSGKSFRCNTRCIRLCLRNTDICSLTLNDIYGRNKL